MKRTCLHLLTQNLIAEENRRKKLMLPQPREDKSQYEKMKEISRLRKMAPLRCEDVKIRFHLDKRCSCCRRYEHVLVSRQYAISYYLYLVKNNRKHLTFLALFRFRVRILGPSRSATAANTKGNFIVQKNASWSNGPFTRTSARNTRTS